MYPPTLSLFFFFCHPFFSSLSPLQYSFSPKVFTAKHAKVCQMLKNKTKELLT